MKTLATLGKVGGLSSVAVKIMPDHSIVRPRENLQWLIHQFGTSSNQAQAAINEDVILEQTVQRSSMPEFGGAAVFGGIRSGLWNWPPIVS